LVLVSPRERLATLDVLRGFALLWVLIGNLVHLYSGSWGSRHEPGSTVDVITAWFVELLVQSKAQTLLTFLFGFGFAAQLLRAQDRGEPVLGLYVRRLAVLLGFAMLHLLIWWGDVLWTYAVAGFGLLLFVRTSNRVRAIAAAVLIFVPAAIYGLPGVGAHVFGWFADPALRMTATTKLVATLHHGGYLDVVRHQLAYFPDAVRP